MDEVKHKVGRPRKVNVNLEEEREKQREYMRNYMKEYMARKKDDPVFMEKQRDRVRKYQHARKGDDEEYRQKKLEYSKSYYNKMKEAYKNTKPSIEV